MKEKKKKEKKLISNFNAVWMHPKTSNELFKVGQFFGKIGGGVRYDIKLRFKFFFSYFSIINLGYSWI
jgi:hypothetical protein